MDLLHVLFQRVCDQGQDFLVLIKQEHGPEIAQALVCETRRSQQLQAFYLAEMGSFTKRKEVEEFCDIVPSVAGQRCVGGGQE